MTNTINIQSIGQVSAKPAVEFSIGEKMMWNFGISTVVTGVAKETAKMITYILQDGKGQNHERKLKKSRLVAIA